MFNVVNKKQKYIVACKGKTVLLAVVKFLALKLNQSFLKKYRKASILSNPKATIWRFRLNIF
jgi:hypothetical protein